MPVTRYCPCRRALFILMLVGLAGLLGGLCSPSASVWVRAVPARAAQAATPAATPQPTTGQPSGAAASEPQQVTVGLYLSEVHGLDQQESTYFADFYMWMRWRGDRDPTPTLELLNNVARWTLTMTPIFPKPVALPGGETLQQFHVQGQFYEPLLLEDYPLDAHHLRDRDRGLDVCDRSAGLRSGYRPVRHQSRHPDSGLARHWLAARGP